MFRVKKNSKGKLFPLFVLTGKDTPINEWFNADEGSDTYKWFNADGLSCTVPEFLMLNIKSDGYLEDKDDVMYLLQNIVSIDWKLIDQKVVLDNFYHKYQVRFRLEAYCNLHDSDTYSQRREVLEKKQFDSRKPQLDMN